MAYKLKTVLDDELDRNIKAQEKQEQQQAQEKPTVNTTQNTARTTTVSSTVPATQTNNATPVKSAAVDQAYALLQQQQTNNLIKWQDAADAYLSRYENRDQFTYDVNKDALYQQYRDMYVNQGILASMDVMGQAATMTGGYGNSYAQSVGHQAYNQYLGQLNTIVPELYQQEYDRYAQEGQNLLNMYDIYTNRENQEYARDWEKQMFEYQKERDKVADEQWLKSFNRSSSSGGSVTPNYATLTYEEQKKWTKEFEGATSIEDLQWIADRMEAAKIDPKTVANWYAKYAQKFISGNSIVDTGRAVASNVGNLVKDSLGIFFGGK